MDVLGLNKKKRGGLKNVTSGVSKSFRRHGLLTVSRALARVISFFARSRHGILSITK